MIDKYELDRTDYILAVSCGVLAGIVDVVFVGDPKNNILEHAIDAKADSFVIKAAQFFYDNDKRTKMKPKKRPDELHKCISYLEQAFPVNYDARYAKDLNVTDGILSDMNPKNHHLKSLAHSTDIIGLVFSIIEQFSAGPLKGSAYVDKGRIIYAVPKEASKNKFPYLEGKDGASKLFCGFVNWLGHLASDMVGSSSTRAPGKDGRGTGLPMPFYELFLGLDVGDFNGRSFADTMVKVYEDGYDFRFGIVTAIPVVFEELLIRCVWTIRQKLIHKKSWKDSLASSKNDAFRTMLLLGSTTFTVVDGADATIRAVRIEGAGLSFNWVSFLSRVNYIGLTRLTELIVNECRYRIKRAWGDDEYLESIFGKLPDQEREKYIMLASSVKSYVEYIDFKNAYDNAKQEYLEAKEERIRAEQVTRENIAKINEYRQEMFVLMEDYFSGYLDVFSEGIDTMDEGTLENDSDKFINGNNMIQNKLGRDAQFDDQEEFDDLMESGDSLVF